MSKSHEHVYRCQDCDEIGTSLPTEPHYDLEEYKRLAPEVKKIIQEEGRVPTEPTKELFKFGTVKGDRTVPTELTKHKLEGYFSDDNPNKVLNDKFNEIDPDGKMADDLLLRRFSAPTDPSRCYCGCHAEADSRLHGVPHECEHCDVPTTDQESPKCLSKKHDIEKDDLGVCPKCRMMFTTDQRELPKKLDVLQTKAFGRVNPSEDKIVDKLNEVINYLSQPTSDHSYESNGLGGTVCTRCGHYMSIPDISVCEPTSGQKKVATASNILRNVGEELQEPGQPPSETPNPAPLDDVSHTHTPSNMVCLVRHPDQHRCVKCAACGEWIGEHDSLNNDSELWSGADAQSNQSKGGA